jgi:hypothetical protein
MVCVCVEARTYETVTDDFVLEQYRCGGLGVLVVVVLDEGGIGYAVFLLDQNRDFDDFSEARRSHVPGF